MQEEVEPVVEEEPVLTRGSRCRPSRSPPRIEIPPPMRC